MQKKKFIPLSHDDLELKRSLLQYARDLKNKPGFENVLAAAFIYSSFTEYVAENLLENLRHFVYQAVYSQYAAILFIDERDDIKKKTLGQIIGELEKFYFPDKQAILRCMRNVSEARNRMFHNFAKSNHAGLEELISKDLWTIQDQSEELINKIDVIYQGLGKILTSTEISPTPNDSEVTKNTQYPEVPYSDIEESSQAPL